MVEMMMGKAKEMGEHVFLGFWGKWVVISRENRGVFLHYTALRVASKLALAVPKAQGFAFLFRVCLFAFCLELCLDLINLGNCGSIFNGLMLQS